VFDSRELLAPRHPDAAPNIGRFWPARPFRSTQPPPINYYYRPVNTVLRHPTCISLVGPWPFPCVVPSFPCRFACPHGPAPPLTPPTSRRGEGRGGCLAGARRRRHLLRNQLIYKSTSTMAATGVVVLSYLSPYKPDRPSSVTKDLES
jgi:hypothetical protein